MRPRFVDLVRSSLFVVASTMVTEVARAEPDPAVSCQPACRSGYTCVEGRCVSACNPPCAANEVCATGGACVTSAPAVSYAETVKVAATPAPAPESDSPPPANTNASTNADANVHTSSARLHDGFYFRGAVGFGTLASGSVTPPGGGGDVKLAGSGPAVELAFGGTLSSGLVVGGGIYGMSIGSPSYSRNSASVDGGAALVSTVGPFIDWYPNPAGGFHFQVSIGWAILSAGKGSKTPTYPARDQSGNGFALLGGAGYEWWIADQWSLGVIARVQYASGSVKGDGDTDSTSVSLLMPALLVGVTYH